MTRSRRGYADIGSPRADRRKAKTDTRSRAKKAPNKTVTTSSTPREAHRMVDAADTHRTHGTVRGRRHTELVGQVVPDVLDGFGRPSFDLQRAWDGNWEADVFRKSDYNHLSDLMTKCHRMLAIINRYDLYPAPKRLFDQSVIVFAQGNMLHDEARRRYANQIPDQFYGFWRCACKQTCEEGTLTSVRDLNCEHCGTHLDEYVELRVIFDDLRVGHSIDGLILLPSGQLQVVEIKSCTRELFEGHKARGTPDMDHVGQAASYWKALRVAGYDVTDKASIVYVCKEHVTPSQSTVLSATMSEALVRSAVDPYFSDIALINEIDFTAPLPPRKSTCDKCGHGGSKYCAAAALCFLLPESGEWNGTVEVI